MPRPTKSQDFLQMYFGPYAVPVWNQIGPILEAMTSQAYSFMNMETFDELIRKDAVEGQAVYWSKMLSRIHLTSCFSIRRHSEWLRSLFLSLENDCLFGAYACYRGFLESAADSFYTLGPVPKTIAPHLSTIKSRIDRKPMEEIFASGELEDRLIHFSHGRKLHKDEAKNPIHAARQIREYLEGIKVDGINDVHVLYGELCSVTHPSAESVAVFLKVQDKNGEVVWQQNSDTMGAADFEAFLNKWKTASSLVFNVAFVPAFICLRILHKFNTFPKIPRLKTFPFDDFSSWDEIKKHLVN